jgi:hypothetical protein
VGCVIQVEASCSQGGRWIKVREIVDASRRPSARCSQFQLAASLRLAVGGRCFEWEYLQSISTINIIKRPARGARR